MISLQNNLAAMMANKNLNINTNLKSKSMNKLSSGFQINRASDNAAGLSISEKMRAQIRGLEQASDNIQDGISLLQTADGSLSEVHAMLQRMTELTVQASNDTNTAEERQNIEKEIAALTVEINRIGNDTEFNTQKLFDGHNPIMDNPLPSVNRNYQISGIPTDATITDYNVTADITTGLTINGNSYPWSMITDGGASLADEPISAGTYSVTYNGVSLSFNVDDIDSIDTVTKAVDGLDFQVTTTPPKVATVNSMDFKLYTPAESALITKEEFLDFIDEGFHEINADEYGIGIDLDTYTSWDDMFSTSGMSADNALATGGTFTIGIAGQYELTIGFNPGSTKESIIEELNGVDFNIDGAVSDKNVTECITPVGGMNATALAELNLSAAFCSGLGYDMTAMYSDQIKAVYNTANTVEPENKYRIGLEFVPSSEGHLMMLWLDDASKSRLQSIFEPGDITSSNGSIQLDFVNNLYSSSFSMQFDYPANINYSDIFRTGSFLGIDGQDALKFTVNSSYEVTNLSSNPVDTTGSADYMIDTSGLSLAPGVIDDTVGRFAIQAGANTGQVIYLDIDKMNSTVLGIDNVKVSNHGEASQSIGLLHNAVNIISKQRGKIGAYQNRLEHALSNSGNSSENLQRSESQIRDTDVAREAVKLAKYSIMEQASQAVLAQANQGSSRLLKLLS